MYRLADLVRPPLTRSPLLPAMSVRMQTSATCRPSTDWPMRSRRVLRVADSSMVRVMAVPYARL